MTGWTREQEAALSEVEQYLRSRFDKNASKQRVPTESLAARQGGGRLDQLILKDDERAKLPETKEKYIIKENPHLVQWERETRKFLVKLNPKHGHRVTGSMIYEWATGINIKELYDRGGNANRDLRKINRILEFYFGKPYMTYMMGRKVPKAYKVPPGFYIKRHRPMTLSLYHEYSNKTLVA